MFSERNRKRMPNRKCFTNTLNKQKQEKPRFSWDSKLFSLKNVSSGENKLNEGILDLIITPITLAVIGRSCTEHKPTTHIILKFNFFLFTYHTCCNECMSTKDSSIKLRAPPSQLPWIYLNLANDINFNTLVN